MSEALTQVDKDDSLRPLYEAARRVGYLSAATRTFEVWRETVSDHELDDARRIIAIEAKSEHKRLEREVIEKAKEFTDDKAPRDNWNPLVAYRELCRAVDALTEFESQHGRQK